MVVDSSRASSPIPIGCSFSDSPTRPISRARSLRSANSALVPASVELSTDNVWTVVLGAGGSASNAAEYALQRPAWRSAALSADDASGLFDFHAQTSRNVSDASGANLRLAVARRIVAALHGEIVARPGTPVSVSFSLPLAREDP